MAAWQQAYRNFTKPSILEYICACCYVGIFGEANKIEHKKRNGYYCNGIKRAGKGKIQYEIEWQKDCEGHGSNEPDRRSGMHQNRLYQKFFQWIVKEGFASEDVAERIADAVCLPVGEILLPEITWSVENVIEFTKDSNLDKDTSEEMKMLNCLKSDWGV